MISRGIFLIAMLLANTASAFNFVNSETGEEILRSTTGLMSPKQIGTGKGFTLRKSVGLAKLSENGSFIPSSNKRSHCTSATHAVFLKTLASLKQQGKIGLSPKAIKTLNSSRFWNIWNSNGYGPLKLIDDLGGTVFRGAGIKALKPGDFVKLDRKSTGHMVIFKRFKGSQICYWSSNRSTNGLGEKCESLKGKTIFGARLPRLNELSANLNTLAEKMKTSSVYAQVRKRGGYGYVAINSAKNIYSSRDLASAYDHGTD